MNRVIFWVLVGTVLLSPVPFGSIFPWAYTLLAGIVCLLLAISALLHFFSNRAHPPAPGDIRISAILFAAVILWLIVQAATWSPAAWHNAVWIDTARALGHPAPGAISVDPFATETGIMRLLTYAGIFWLGVLYGRSELLVEQTFRAFVIAGMLYAAYGLTVQLTDAGTILWYEKERYRDSLTATFRYKNAYATYAGMGLVCTVTLLVHNIAAENLDAMGPRERLRTILTLVFAKTWYLIAALLLIFTALLLSNSRAGLFASVLAIVALFVLLGLAPRNFRPNRTILSGLLVAGGIAFVAVSGSAVVDRVTGTQTQQELRSKIYTATVQAISERPFLGWGLGAFEGVFAKYQSRDFTSRTIRAHNEYLDNALGMGIPAAAALVAALAWIGFICVRGIRQRRRSNYFPAAGVAILTLAGLHALVDFTFQVPAISATFSLLLGMCCAQSWNSNGNGNGIGKSTR